jgi:membrane protease YdiL (CAAX protease family)
MNIFGDIVTAVGFAVAALSCFYLIPDFLPGNGDAMLQYAVMAAVAFYIIRAKQVSTYRFFRLPEVSVVSGIGIVLAVIYGWMRTFTDEPVSLSLSAKILGLLYLLLIGLGEEFVSRGFIFSIFEKYGMPVAVFASSLIFGLMHLNLYRGKYWNAPDAYFHVVNTFGFAVLAAAVMLATKSIWVAVLMHAVADWSVIFSKNAPEGYIPPVKPFDPLWQVIQDSFGLIEIPLIFSTIIFTAMWISRRKSYPKLIDQIWN